MVEKTFKNLVLGRLTYLSVTDKHFVCKDRRDALNYCLFRTGENGGKCKFLASIKLPAVVEKEDETYNVIFDAFKQIAGV